MDRDVDTVERDQAPEERASDACQRRSETRLSREREDPSRFETLSREPAVHAMRGAFYSLSPAELGTMNDIGRFRTVAVTDLERHRYSGNASVAGTDLRELRMQGLLQIKTVQASARQAPLTVAVLTRLGREVLVTHGAKQGRQAHYSGFVKPREVPHDAAIYRMFQAEREQIERAGGRVSRVVLDYELKRRVYAPLAKLRSITPKVSAREYAKCQAEVAQQNGLKVINGRIPLPDLRLEYETSTGEAARVDLELATSHYHGKAMQTKAQAGFTFYAADGCAAQLARVMEERDITVAILSL